MTGARLDHPRLRAPARRCSAGRRGSSSARSRSSGFALGRVHRHAARPAAAPGRRASRRTRRSSAWSARCSRARSWRRASRGSGSRLRARCCGAPGLAAARRAAGRACSRACAGARDRVDARRGRAADPGRARAAGATIQRSAILRGSTTSCRRRARCSTRSRGSTRSRASTGPRRDVPGAARRRSRATREVAAAARERRAGPRHGVRAGRRGLGLGGRRTGVVVTNAHVVAGQDDTRVLLRGPRAGARRDAGRLRPAQRRRGPARRRGSARRRCRSPARRRSGTSAAILGFPRNGPYDVRAGARSARRATVAHPGRLRPRAGAALDHSLRGAVRSGNSGGPVVDGRGRVVDDGVRGDRDAGRAAATACPNAIVRRALAGAARRGVDRPLRG